MEGNRPHPSFGSQRHYHIRWSAFNLDWCAFPTEEEAKIHAQRLARPRENYAIEQYDANCERCKGFKAEACR